MNRFGIYILSVMVCSLPLFHLGCESPSKEPPPQTATRDKEIAPEPPPAVKGPPPGADRSEPALEALREQGVPVPSDEDISGAADEIAGKILSRANLVSDEFHGKWKPDPDEMKGIVEAEAKRIREKGRTVSPTELRNALQPLLRERALAAADREVEAFLGKEGVAAVEEASAQKAKEWARGAGSKEKGEEMEKALTSRLQTLIRSRLKRSARERVQSSLPSRIQPILMEAIRSTMRGSRGRGR